MKRQSLKTVLTAGAIALGSGMLHSQPSYGQPAPGERGFWCDTSSGSPVTMYQTAQGNQEPWIRWTSDTFADSGYDQLTRCREVSGRLENYRVNKQLKYITVGMMNRQRVVCTTTQANGRCEGLIYTLKPGQDAVRTLNNFLAWSQGQAGVPSLYESGSIPYIDVSGRLEEDAASATKLATPTSVQPLPPQPSQNGMQEL